MTNPVIDKHGTQEWYQNGKRHRADGPAIIDADGSQSWYKNDKLHRTDGPAIIYANGKHEWWLNEKRYYDVNDYVKEIFTHNSKEKMVFLLKWSAQ